MNDPDVIRNFLLFGPGLVFVMSLLAVIFLQLGRLVNKQQKYWKYFNIPIFSWALSSYMGMSSIKVSEAVFWLRTANLLIPIIGFCFYYFFSILSRSFSSKESRYLFLLCLLYVVISISKYEYFINGVYLSEFNIAYPQVGLLYHLNPSIFMGFVLFGTYKLASQISIEHSLTEKKILRKMMVGFILGSLGVLLTLLQPYGFILGSAGFYFVPAYLLMMFYIIVKHHVFDLNIVVEKSLVYSILIGSITILYLVVILGLEYCIQKAFNYSSKYVSIIISFSIGIFFIPLRNSIQRFVDKTIFNKTQEEIFKENMKLKQEIILSERMKSSAQMAAGLAHEIKNPLQTIRTFFDYFEEKKDDKVFIEKFFSMAKKEVDRITSLVKQLLDFARPAESVFKNVNLSSILSDTISFNNGILLKKSIHVLTKIEKDIFVLADENQLKQVFSNLIINSFDAMNEKGKLEISAVLNTIRNEVKITIRDNGCGMTEEQLDKIFTPFYTNKETGNGLGMAVVYEIIKKHNGNINIISSVGLGTTTTIDLPL